MAFDLPVVYHSNVDAPPYQRELVVQRFWGVVGAQLLRSRIQIRELTVQVTLTDHDTLQSFYNAIALMDQQLDEEDTGTFFADGIEWEGCTFLGYLPRGDVFWDGSGEHGFTQFGEVKFLQAKTPDNPPV